ncbi:hypothetical protein TSST111916_20070 [Tsukamurella strandjordii]
MARIAAAAMAGSRIEPPLRSAQAITPKAAVAAATTGSSMLWKAYSASGGVIAQIAAVRPETLARIQPVSRPNGASSSAMCARNSASLVAPIAPTQNSSPLSTGYSIAPPCSLPSASIQPVRYGKTWLFTSRPDHRYCRSE